MVGIKGNPLFGLIHDFLVVYLPTQRNSSPNTIKAYRTSLEQLLDHVKEQRGCGLAAITFDVLDCNMVTSYLNSMEENGRCGISTRNHRLKCIRAFYNYAAMMDVSLIVYRQELAKIPWKKSQTPEFVDFMSEAAVKVLLEQPNTGTLRGLRDQFMMILLYDTGARIQELLDLKVCDIRLGTTPTAKLMGKGTKVRTVPIMPQTVLHLKNYLSAFQPDEGPYSQESLFYVTRNGVRQKMSDDNVRKLLRSYGEAAKAVSPEIPDNLHPHLFRHSRAMHLYQHGMDLTLISQWLGHANLETTLIYAHADTEMKRKAIEKATSGKCDVSPRKPTQHNYGADEDEVLKRLYGLR